MTIFCEQCGRPIHPDHLFCRSCGADSPKITKKGEWEEEFIDNPIFCPSCGTKNTEDALFCSQCGHNIIKNPTLEEGNEVKRLYCPSCGRKNSPKARICAACSFSIEDWFLQKGTAAQSYGLTGNFILHESMNGVSYHFCYDRNIIIGRDGNISIPCSFISANHVQIDFENFTLSDLDSTNGTFINRSPERIGSATLATVTEFNLGGYFTFTVKKKDKLLFYRLTAILEEKECARQGDIEEFEKLRDEFFVYPGSNGVLYIGKYDRKLTFNPIKEDVYWSITVENGFYYYSDPDNGIDQQLILKQGNNFPVNWMVTFPK